MALPAVVCLVTLGVRDVAAATRFYRRLGFPLSPASVPGEVSFLRTSGGLLGLYGADAQATDAGRLPRLLHRPRRPRLGTRAQPLLAARRRRRPAAAGVSPGYHDVGAAGHDAHRPRRLEGELPVLSEATPPAPDPAGDRPAVTIARFKDLCIDVASAEREGAFWAAVLGLAYRPDPPSPDGVLRGTDPARTVWLNAVPEPSTVKNRVHLDVVAASLEQVVALGATPLSAPGQFRWTVCADPEGQQFCVFEREQLPDYRLYELVVDCADPLAQARWWAGVLGGEAGAGDGYAWVGAVAGMPFDEIAFVPVPEPKTVKNRVHWDVTAAVPDAVERFVALGASILRRRDDEIEWDVLADPEGNEFCVFGA